MDQNPGNRVGWKLNASTQVLNFFFKKKNNIIFVKKFDFFTVLTQIIMLVLITRLTTTVHK